MSAVKLPDTCLRCPRFTHDGDSQDVCAEGPQACLLEVPDEPMPWEYTYSLPDPTPPLVYVCAPYRADNSAGVAFNRAIAEVAGMLLMRAGFHVIVPHSLSSFDEDGEFDHDVWLRVTLDVMRRCDGVALVGRWEDSEGCTAEKAEAERLRMDVRDVEGWLT